MFTNYRPVRLSPSGPFIVDSNSGNPLLGGPGQPGITYRANGDRMTAQTITAGTTVPGLEALAWPMPSGYHYDCELYVEVTDGTAGTITADIQVSSTGTGGPWTSIDSTHVQHVVTTVAAQVKTHRVNYEPATAVTHVRAFCTGPTGANVVPAMCSLRIASYVQ